MLRRAASIALVSIGLVSILAALPSLAHAGGLEYVAPGTRAFGRGGAFMARADDPMALRYNPAALAHLGGYQLSAETHLAFYDACVRRSGGYDDSGVSDVADADSVFGFPDRTDPNNFASMQFPEVCRNGAPGPSPQVLASLHLAEGLGIAFGILAPAGVGSGMWGNGDGTITSNGITLPSPVRYQIVQQNVLLFHPSIGIGYSPIPEVSFGATFMWGIAMIDFTTMTSAGSGPQDPARDVRARLELSDWFVPAAVFSVHVTPIDALDIVAMGRISDAIEGEGSLTVTTGAFGTSMAGGFSPFTTPLQNARLRAGQPWEFGLSVRYADRIRPRRRNPERSGRLLGRIDDPMSSENWDLELDVVYVMSSQVTDYVMRPPAGQSVGICEGARDCVRDGTAGLMVSLPNTIPIAKGWSDQLSIRLGGDVNVIPGTFALRGGVHFETSGMNANYQGPDFMPGMRLGLHLGATLRIERFDVSIAYGHIFQFDHTVAVGEGRLRHTASTGGRGPMDEHTCRDEAGNVIEGYDESRPVAQRGCYPPGFGSVTNEGTYTAGYNVLSLHVRYHFE
ncbi:MAG: hypothetical protein KF729_33930 [Sandaracinaceae bacterium]|nr:hypothetical protein [Sandaracinaceae bacterium]